MFEVDGASISLGVEIFAGRAIETLGEQPKAAASQGQSTHVFVNHKRTEALGQAGTPVMSLERLREVEDR